MKKILQLLTFATLLATSLSAAEIHDAAERGDLAEVRRLLDGGASVDAQDINGRTPLHEAARNDHFKVAELLLNHDADVNARHSNGSTPLHLATFNFYIKTATLLLNHGANVNAKNNSGRTPLLIVVHYNHPLLSYPHHQSSFRLQLQRELVQLLINNGADVNAKSDIGETALNMTINSKFVQLFKALPRLNKLLWHAFLKNDLLNVRWLLVEGASPHAIALESMFSITNETSEDDINYLRAIIERKDTPLHIAVENRNVDMVKLLLAFGSEIDRPNKRGDTPLKMAAGRPEIIEVIYKTAEPLPGKS